MKPVYVMNRVLMTLSAFWAFFLAVIIMVDVVGRGFFNAPLNGSVEIIKNSIVVIAFLQLAYAVGAKSMLRADFIIHQFPEPIRKTLELISLLVGAGVFGLLCYAVIEPGLSAYRSNSYEGDGALRIPSWPIYATIFFGSLLATINYLILAYEEVASGGGEDA